MVLSFTGHLALSVYYIKVKVRILKNLLSRGIFLKFESIERIEREKLDNKFEISHRIRIKESKCCILQHL